MKRLVCFLLCISAATVWATDGAGPSKTGDIDMNQFKNVPPAQKGPKLKVNAVCEMADGSLRKPGELGYKDCIETKANRIMNQPHPPEAVPYEPRTN